MRWSLVRPARGLPALSLTAVALAAPPLVAQGGAGGARDTGRWYLDVVADWIAADVSPGHEREARLPLPAGDAWQVDATGNRLMRRGSGSPRRVVACPLDRPGYVVSQVTDDGYLRLQHAGPAPAHPLWDQFHEGQRVRVVTRHRAVPGVVAGRSAHLWRRRAADSTAADVESFWVDVGARTRADVASLGVALLDPVARDWPRWIYANVAAGPWAGERAACAAVAWAARGIPARGETVFVLSAQSAFGYAGLAALLAGLGRVDSLVLVDPAAPNDSASATGRRTTNGGNDGSVFVRHGAIDIPLSWPGRYSRSPVEVLDLADVRALGRLIAALAAGDAAGGARP